CEASRYALGCRVMNWSECWPMRAMNRIGRLVASWAARLAMALCIAASSVAAQGAPFPLGEGHDPYVAVDTAGTAHVAWVHAASALTSEVHSCQVARGATGCSHLQTFPGGHGGQPFVLLTPSGTIDLVYPRYVEEDIQLWTSTNGGLGFSGPVKYATAPG